MPDFKPGDRVIMKQVNPHGWRAPRYEGRTATVGPLNVASDKVIYLFVIWDKPNDGLMNAPFYRCDFLPLHPLDVAKPIQTRDGWSARLVDNVKDDKERPLRAYVKFPDGYERVISYSEGGYFYKPYVESPLDLVNAEE